MKGNLYLLLLMRWYVGGFFESVKDSYVLMITRFRFLFLFCFPLLESFLVLRILKQSFCQLVVQCQGISDKGPERKLIIQWGSEYREPWGFARRFWCLFRRNGLVLR